MHDLGITHNYSAPYMPQSNGLPERAVGQAKLYFSKLGELTVPKMQDLFYHLYNTSTLVTEVGSGFMRLFGRQAKSDLPSLPRKFSNELVRLMNLAQENAQNQREAQKKGWNRNPFEI